MTVDIFPDLLGWILLFFGVSALAKHTKGLEKLRFMPLGMMVLSALSLLKDTLWFSNFHVTEKILLTEDGSKTTYSIAQNMAGICFDICNHLLEVLFIILLFRVSALVCFKKGEEKLSASHKNVPKIAAVEGLLYLVSNVALLFPMSKGLTQAFTVLSRLDNLFMVLLVWYAAIAMVRALIRISD